MPFLLLHLIRTAEKSCFGNDVLFTGLFWPPGSSIKDVEVGASQAVSRLLHLSVRPVGGKEWTVIGYFCTSVRIGSSGRRPFIFCFSNYGHLHHFSSAFISHSIDDFFL
jgi:hypothetical protein